MRSLITVLLTASVLVASAQSSLIEKVASFKGEQVTGVTVSKSGRLFANFPRWRKGVSHSVIEVVENGTPRAFPDKQWNSWRLGQPMAPNVFVAIQSVVVFENSLYVLDTRNPLFKGVVENPRIFEFDLSSNQLVQTYILESDCYFQESYINDLRIDSDNGKMYLTDSGRAGLVIIDLKDHSCFRALDNHSSTLAETDELTFKNGVWKNTVHSDGIALDTKNNILYYHALTGYSLYRIATDKLLSKDHETINKSVEYVAKTPAPDGMIIDDFGYLYLADLENDRIMKLEIASGKLSTAAEDALIKWADSFSIYNNELYYTNSRINEASTDISEMEFGIYKFRIH